MKHLTNPPVLRLAAYVVAGIIGIVMVVAGRIDASGLEEWVTSAQTSLGTLLTLVAALAGANIDRTAAPRVDVADLPTVREAVADVINGHATDALADVAERVDTAKHRLEDRVNVNIQESADPRELLADMQRRIVATRAGRAAGD
jgi:regulator of protease activity HflC (stomatin/prohibitin superfamily)